MYRLALLFIIFTWNLQAQNVEDSITFSIDLDEYVITAQFQPIHYKEAIHKVSTIQKETIQKIGAVNLEQALTVSPAIRIYQDPILGTSIRMRGISSSNVAVLMDGIPVIGRNDGSIDISQIPLQNIERIEIVEGPLSSLYGNNAAGGVINLITKKSQVTSWDLELTNQVENIGQQNHLARLGFQKGKFNLSTYGRYFNYGQYPVDSLRIVDEVKLEDGTTSLHTRYPFNPKTQKSYGSFLRYNINEENNVILKYDFNRENVSDYAIVKRPQFNPYAEDQFYETKRRDISLSYEGKIKSNYFINAVVANNIYNRKRDDTWYYLESMTFDSLRLVSDSIKFELFFSRAVINYTGFKDLTIGGGVNLTREHGSGDRILNKENEDSLNVAFTETAFFTDIKYKGLRAVELSLTNRMLFHTIYDKAITTAFQTKVKFHPTLTLRSGISQGYRSPTLKELYLEFIDINHNIIGNTELQPERSIDIQSTLSYYPNDMLSLSFNVYYNRIKEMINLTQYETLKFQYQNIDRYSVYGFQPSLEFKTSDLNLNANLSIGYWETNIEANDAPRYGKLFDMNTTLSYSFPRVDLNLLVNHRYVGSQPLYTLENDVVEVNNIDGYHMMDLSLSKTIWEKRLKLLAGLRNVFDTRFVNVSSGNSGGTHSGGPRNNISIGRSCFASIVFHLNR